MKLIFHSRNFSHTVKFCRTLDKTISSLEMQLAAARAAKAENDEELDDRILGVEQLKHRPKVFFVMGIITAFSSRKRRDSIRETWMPKSLFQTSSLPAFSAMDDLCHQNTSFDSGK